MKNIKKILKTLLMAAVVAASVAMTAQTMVPEKVHAEETASPAGTEAILKSYVRNIDGFSSSAVSFQKGTKDGYEANQSSAKEIQDSSSPEKIYMWHDGSNNYYWYSPAANVYLPANSSDLFYYCSHLTTLNLEDFNTSNVTNMSYMFYGCSSLTSLDVSNLDTSKVTNMGGMFSGCSRLTDLDVSHLDTSNVTNMSYMFAYCSALTNLNVSNLNTSKVTNMSNMFDTCYSLPSLDVSNLDTSKVTNMNSMFHKCSSLSNLDVSNLDTSKVTNMGGMFSGCSRLTDLDVSHLDTSNVTNMGGMFDYCQRLTNLDVSNFHTSNVTNMNGMFYGCSGLTDLDVSHFDTSKVTDMSNMFNNCSKLTDLDVSHFDTSNVTNMAYMFNFSSKLTNLDVSNWNTSKVTNMNSMFDVCSSLANLDVSKWDTSKVTNIGTMFNRCSSLKLLDLGGWDMSKVTSAGSAFAGLQNLTAITFPTTYPSNPQSGDGSLSGFYKVNDDGTATDTAYDLTKLNQTTMPMLAGRWVKNPWPVISSSFKSVKFYNSWPSSSYAASANSFLHGTKADYEANKNYAQEIQDSSSIQKIYMWHDDSNNYYWYSPANKVYLPADCSNLFKYDESASSGGKWTSYRGVTKIDLTGLSWDLVTNTNSMFASNGNLSSINLGNINTSNVTDMADMFDYCPKLTTLDVSNFDTSKVTNMNSMFYYCSSLTSLDVSKWNTSKVTNMNSMFYDCSSLTSLDVSNFDTSNVTDMGNMFNDCSSLTNLDVSKWNTSNVTSMYGMFQHCSKLTDLDVSHFDTSNVTSTASMFSVCSSVTSLDIGKWNTSNVTDMAGMFSGCSKLTTLDVSNWDTSKVTDMGRMFSGCSNLTSLDVSKFNTSKVTGMSNMFSDCSNLTSLDLSNFDTSTVTSKASEGFMTDEKDMFKGMTSLQKITFGSGFKVVPPTTDRWGRTYGGIGSQPIMQDWHKTADADGNSVSGAPIVDLGTLIDSNDTSVPGTWVKVKPFSYWLSVKGSDGKPIKNYALTEKDIFVYGESADKTGYITKTDSSSAIVDNDMMVHLKYPESNADLVHKEGDEGVSVDTSIKDSRSVYTLNIVPAIDSGYQAKTVTIRATIADGISSDTTKCEINGATFNPDKGILTVTLDKQSESSDTPSDNAGAQYFAKEKEVEINDNADFVLKLSTPSTTGQTYSADNTASDMSYGILLDTIPGIDSISETSSDSETDKTAVSNWVKTWSVKIGDTVLSDDQKAAAFQNYVPVFKQAKTYEGELVNVAGVKMDLTYLESIGLAGQPVEITMSHKVVAEKLKDGKYTTKAFVYSDSSYDALFSTVTSVNSSKDPFADYGSVTDSDGIGRIHIYNAASGNSAPDKEFTFKIVPDDDTSPLPEGATVLTDDNGKKYATVTIKGNGMYTGTLVFPKSGTKTYGYTISTVSDGTDGWTFDNTTYHTVFSDDNGSIGAWTGDISINGTLLCVHNESAVYPQPEWTWNKDLEKSYYDKISDVKQKVLNTISIVDTCLLPNNLGFAFEQTYKSESVPATPKLTRSRFAKMAYVSTPNVDYDMTLFKDITGDNIPDKYSFSAVIAPDDENCPMPTNADSWYDATKHTVTLDSSDGGRARTLNFTATAPGTYGYTVTEVKDGRYGWDYDTHTYHVTYTVADGTVSSIVQTVDGTAITDAQKDANAGTYKAYAGSDPASKDALVVITNNHFTMTTPTGVYDSGVKPLIVACVVIGAAAISFVLIRNKKR